MAKEIINYTERFNLVQIDKEGTVRVVYQYFTGSFTTSDSASYAQDFKSEENAKKTAETLNLFYQLTGNQNGVKVVKE
uniref:hypothetical protein n=1 Tax=Staphylococcus aureus TaxID=1280 RepID=UPI0008515AA3